MASKQMKHKPKPKKKRVGKKKFFDATIPMTTAKVSLYGYAAEDFEGRFVKLDLSKSMRGKNVELRAKLALNEKKLVGQLHGLRLIPTYIKRVMRRGTDYVEDSFEVIGKEHVFRIKPFLITRKRVSRAVRNALRTTAKKHLESKVVIMKTEELFSNIMTNKFQKDLSMKLKKIYPLALCEIRVLEVLRPAPEKKEKKAETKESKTDAETKE